LSEDDKAALYLLNAILKFDFVITLVVAEHILISTVVLTNYLQKCDIDLLEAATEAKIVIRRYIPMKGTMFMFGKLFYTK
jgi:hypothetical protein